MTDDLRTRIIAAAATYFKESGAYFDHYTDDNSVVDGDISLIDLADAVIAELNIPDRTHVDDEGRTWEWCGGIPGTWAWRITGLQERGKWDCSQSDWSADDD